MIGGKAPYSISSIGLPPGLTITDGVLHGTPHTEGTYSVTIRASESFRPGEHVSLPAHTMVVGGLPLEFSSSAPPAELSHGASMAAYGIQAFGGLSPYSYAAVGSLPPGISLNPDSGALTGATSGHGTFTYSLTASDSAQPIARTGATPNRTVTVYQRVAISGASPSFSDFGKDIEPFGFTATGGKAPLTYSISSRLPTGLHFDTGTGLIHGKPIELGTYGFVVTATDVLGASHSSLTQTLTISHPMVFATAASLPDATQGTPYSVTIGVSGGRAPYQWSQPEALPEGFKFNTSSSNNQRVLEGTTSETGQKSFTINVTDADGRTASRTFSVNILAGTPGANRALIDQVSVVNGHGFWFSTYLDNVGQTTFPDAARALAVAKDPTVYSTAHPGSGFNKAFYANQDGVLLQLTYRHSQPVQISGISHLYEVQEGYCSAYTLLSYETSSDGSTYTPLTTVRVPSEATLITRSGSHGSLYNVDKSVTPIIVKYVRLTISTHGYTSSCGSTSYNALMKSGIVR